MSQADNRQKAEFRSLEIVRRGQEIAEQVGSRPSETAQQGGSTWQGWQGTTRGRSCRRYANVRYSASKTHFQKTTCQNQGDDSVESMDVDDAKAADQAQQDWGRKFTGIMAKLRLLNQKVSSGASSRVRKQYVCHCFSVSQNGSWGEGTAEYQSKKGVELI